MKSVYLKDVPLPQAQERFHEALAAAGLWQVLGTEDLPLNENLLGRVLSQPVWAKISSPHYNASAMDGYAVLADETREALPSRPVTLQIGDKAVYVDTGDALPSWANAVIPIEHIEPVTVDGKVASNLNQASLIRLRSAVVPWSHIRPVGEDIVATELVLPAGHILRAVDLGALAASGQANIQVARRPHVAILPTGTELKQVGAPVVAGQIIEYNSIVLAAQVLQWGGEPVRYPILPDQLDQICQMVQEAAQNCDLVLLNAGSSAGSEDYTSQVVECLGELLVHGVAVRPGHPVILGMLNLVEKNGQASRKIPCIGVPGYPVSAALTGEIFIEPLLAHWLGRDAYHPLVIDATVTRKVTSPPGDEDYVRVAVGKVGDHMLAAPLSRGAGVISSMVKADGIVIIPRDSQGLEAGTPVKVRLYRSLAEIEQTILAIGSHDLSLDLLAQHLMKFHKRLVSANVGSLGGLIALNRGEAHLAGSHLLDPQTGEYNTSYIREHLSGKRVIVLGWVNRLQGLMVLPGNPKSIFTLADLIRPGVTFVNRQKGAGTRVLLDFHLKEMGLSALSIIGYNQEEYTHLAVAAAVLSGRADCALGIAGAAKALGLDFIPLYEERYDLIVPHYIYESDLFSPAIELAQDPLFRQEISAIPGYKVGNMGIIIESLG